MPEPLRHQPDSLETRLTAALEAAPQVAIPHDFTARVASRLSALPQATETRPSRVGVWTLRAALALFVLAMFLVATLSSGAGHDMLLTESILASEFVVLASWAALRPTLLR